MLSLPVANGPHEGHYCSAISQARISALSVAHDDLDAAIDALVDANTYDDLIVARLKKRRLQIRDEIAGLVAAQMRDAPDATVGAAVPAVQSGADSDAEGPHTAEVEPAPRPGGGSFVFGVFVTLSTLLMLGLGWSGIVDSVNQTVAQIYILSLLAAANG